MVYIIQTEKRLHVFKCNHMNDECLLYEWSEMKCNMNCNNIYLSCTSHYNTMEWRKDWIKIHWPWLCTCTYDYIVTVYDGRDCVVSAMESSRKMLTKQVGKFALYKKEARNGSGSYLLPTSTVLTIHRVHSHRQLRAPSTAFGAATCCISAPEYR